MIPITIILRWSQKEEWKEKLGLARCSVGPW